MFAYINHYAAEHFSQLPAEIKTHIIAQADSIDTALKLITFFDQTNKQMSQLLRDQTTIGQIIVELGQRFDKPFPFVATMLSIKAPTWIKKLITSWLTAYNQAFPQPTALATVESLNSFYELDKTMRNEAVIDIIQKCIRQLLDAKINISTVDQTALIGKGIQMFTLLFPSGSRNLFKLGTLLLDLGLQENYSFRLEQGVTFYDKRATTEQKKRLRPFLHSLALKGGILRSPDTIRINEQYGLGLPIGQ